MSWLGRIVASTVVRRLTLLALAALLAWAGIGKAAAATTGPGACEGYNDECNRAQAYAAANAKGAASGPGICQMTGGAGNTYVRTKITVTLNTPAQGDIQAKAVCSNGSDTASVGLFYWYGVECPAGETWDNATSTCKGPNNCASKPPINGAGMKAPGCYEGCEYFPASPNRRLDAANTNAITFANTWGASGAACTTETPKVPYDPDKPVCFQPPGATYTECVASDGRHCITSARGTRMCWDQGETGPRQSADGKDAADRRPEGEQPTAPTNISNPQQEKPSTPTVINNSTYNSASYTGGGTTGAGQGNTGTGGKDAGAGGDAGEGDDEGPGSAAGPLADPYEGEEETVATVYADYQSRLSSTPFGNAITQFFTVQTSGTCPTWSVPSSEWWPVMVFDYHCTGILASSLALVGYVLLAVVAYKAFQIAVY